MPVQPDEVTDTLFYTKADGYITEDSSVTVLNNKRLNLYGSVWLNGLPLSANEGGGGQVLSVNGEIGNVQLDAAEIPVSPSGTVQSHISTLNTQTANKAEKSVSIGTVAPLTGGGDLSTSRLLDINTFTAVTKGAVPPPVGVTGKFLKDNGTWDVPAGGSGGVSDGDKGDITVSNGGVLWVVNNGAITKSEVGLANVDNTSDANKPVSTAQQAAIDLKADKTIAINTTAPLTGGGNLSASRTIDLSNFTSTVKGAVPPPITVTGKFLRDDGTWVLPATPVTDGDKGDIVVSGTGATWTIDTAVVTNSKLADMAQNTMKGRISTAGVPQDLSITQSKTLLGLNNVDNTADASKPVSTAQQTALDLKANLTGGTFSGDISVPDEVYGTGWNGSLEVPTKNAVYDKIETIGASGITAEDAVDATAAAFAAGTHTNITVTYNDAANSISLAGAGGGGGITTEDAVDSVATALIPGNNIDITYNDALNTITVDVEALDKNDVGLGNVDNTSDANKPVSTAQATAIGLKADTSTMTTALAGKQPLDTDLTTIAGLTATTDNVIQSVGSAWASRTPAQLKTSLALTKSDVGLGNVDNVSDANAPVSTAQQTALNLKADKTTTITGTGALNGGGDLSANRTLDVANDGITNAKLANMAANSIKGNNTGSVADPIDMTVAQTKTLLALTKTDVGLGNVDNTSDANAPVSTAQQTALNLKADKTVAINTTAPLTGGGDISATRTLDISTFTATVKGAVPPPTTATGKYLKDDGTWAVPASGMSDGDKGDITVGGTGTTLTIDTAAVTNAKMADMNQNTIKGRLSTQGVPQDLTITQTKTLLGLGQVDNTSDANKPVSTAQAAADALKAPLAQAVETLNVGTYTVVATDSGKIKRLGQACTITLPDTGLGVGERVDFTCTAGIATFVLGSGAGWDVTPTPSAVARSLGSVVTAIRMWPTAWLLTGDLA